MKSRISFYNKGFAKSLLRRFWPLWALWLAVLLYAPLQLAGIKSIDYFRELDYINNVNRSLLETGTELAKFSIFAMPVMAMAMLSYLYDRRSCGLINSLPMRREEAYFTAFLTGLVPMLLADVLAFLVMLAVCPRVPGVVSGHLGTWLLLVVLGTVAFYGLACFCGVLTGNIFVLPAVYVVLGCTAQVFEGAVHALLHTLVYGYTYQQEALSWLSPLPTVLMTLNVTMQHVPTPADPRAADTVPAVFSVSGLGYLAAACAVGLLLGVLAVLILKKRHMEAAGEIVAVPVLRPLFRICMAVGTAVVVACILCQEFLSRIVYGRGLASGRGPGLVCGRDADQKIPAGLPPGLETDRDHRRAPRAAGDPRGGGRDGLRALCAGSRRGGLRHAPDRRQPGDDRPRLHRRLLRLSPGRDSAQGGK